ncbi:hypothetical protein FFLO_03722 [Filobasidium floriforme]|uniref:N-acetyl-D-glucosamine kinase n=1 Tax=Filobasidium floriforme TaxID=5210 RepID=A0A8K0JKW1_9TREE|nr:uncharacterized protein HD553DRAFT_320388 [Filobasidium floriforme]KAG7532254.1 hypothetical protein FFLO_03722 [Filobasidium floriforme]KAH8077825.1 hypothetical protein HD553DRAFT_320388 [Filobasidium floriforme]
MTNANMNGTRGYHVCMDVGGTKIAAVIADEHGRQVSRGYAGSGNMAELGVALSSQRIKQAVLDAATRVPGLVLPDPSSQDVRQACPFPVLSAWAGIAGCDSKADIHRMEAALKDFFGTTPVRVTNDSLLLSAPILRASAPWGICVVAGTGSVISGVINEDGVPVPFARRGGHGHIFGDEGSAYHLGVTAVRAITNAFNCGEDLSSSLVVKEICAAVNTDSPGNLPSVLHELDPDVDLLTAVNRRKLRIANLAIPVIASASSQPDDPLVLEIITETTDVLAGEIAHIVKIAERKGLAPVSNATLSVVGGLISQPIYMDAVKQALSRVGVVFGDVQLVQDPAGEGAAALAIPHK